MDTFVVESINNININTCKMQEIKIDLEDRQGNTVKLQLNKDDAEFLLETLYLSISSRT